MNRIINRQVQSIDLRAAIGVLVAVCVVATLIICGAIPCVAFASSLCDSSMHWIINRQVQGINLGAAIGIHMTVGVVATGGVFCAIPCVAFAGSFGER